MTPITYDVQLTADDYLAPLRLHRRRVYWFGRFRFVFWGTFLFLLIGMGLIGADPFAWTTPMLLLFFIGALWFLTEAYPSAAPSQAHLSPTAIIAAPISLHGWRR